jgi:hypothetical protein
VVLHKFIPLVHIQFTLHGPNFFPSTNPVYGDNSPYHSRTTSYHHRPKRNFWSEYFDTETQSSPLEVVHGLNDYDAPRTICTHSEAKL